MRTHPTRSFGCRRPTYVNSRVARQVGYSQCLKALKRHRYRIPLPDCDEKRERSPSRHHHPRPRTAQHLGQRLLQFVTNLTQIVDVIAQEKSSTRRSVNHQQREKALAKRARTVSWEHRNGTKSRSSSLESEEVAPSRSFSFRHQVQ